MCDERFRSVALSLLRVNSEQTFHMEYPGINGSKFNDSSSRGFSMNLELENAGEVSVFRDYRCVSVLTETCFVSRVRLTFT